MSFPTGKVAKRCAHFGHLSPRVKIAPRLLHKPHVHGDTDQTKEMNSAPRSISAVNYCHLPSVNGPQTSGQ